MRCKDVAQERDFQTPIRNMLASHYEMIGFTSPGEEMEFRTLDDERNGMGSDQWLCERRIRSDLTKELPLISSQDLDAIM